jgi:hypothetical protein
MEQAQKCSLVEEWCVVPDLLALSLSMREQQSAAELLSIGSGLWSMEVEQSFVTEVLTSEALLIHALLFVAGRLWAVEKQFECLTAF